ncbi:hypothetical protein MHY1_01077 [Methylovirgula sp. HY1]|nr:hypothetical protein MHY1_01077 [Methylovirgula sp. HY1]
MMTERSKAAPCRLRSASCYGRTVPVIEKISRMIEIRPQSAHGDARHVLLSLPRIKWLEGRKDESWLAASTK